MRFTVAEEPYDGADGQRLVHAMAADMMARYHLTIADDPEPLEAEDFGVFVIARDPQGTAVGCAALRFLTSDTAELKRMYVVPEARGTGAATAVIRTIEELGRAHGTTIITLVTGTAQPEAVRFYQREGYRPTDGFGALAGHPAAVFLARELS
ncbi:GNAT family N-acetyltransferase [Catenuloplanes japonicus]|uniref:GNAT family N-acetyltransferase n=1 Tax=Catenuloplanes japonicus TaxID=33876 RepID=UPI0005271F0D|nr:GNAT family N-acetyltransferase [Catenuloplanes japonicus]